jgi:hypothetical protein
MKPQLKLGEVSHVTGVPITRLGRWLDRETIKPSRSDHRTRGTGDHRTFSRATIIQIAIAKALIELGVGAGAANTAAALFTDCGNAGREPGELFEHGKTMLVVGPEGATVKNVPYDATLADVSNHGVCSITVDLNRIVESVDTILKEVKTR